MEGFYEVLYHDEPVGKVQVISQGLYYRFQCRAQVTDGRVCRLVAQWQNSWENLGILVPEGTGFSLDRKLPAKRMGKTTPIFKLIPSGEEITKYLTLEAPVPEKDDMDSDPVTDQQDSEMEANQEKPAMPEELPLQQPQEEGALSFLPIDPKETFDRIEELEQAVFSVREEQPGILIPIEEEERDQAL